MKFTRQRYYNTNEHAVSYWIRQFIVCGIPPVKWYNNDNVHNCTWWTDDRGSDYNSWNDAMETDDDKTDNDNYSIRQPTPYLFTGQAFVSDNPQIGKLKGPFSNFQKLSEWGFFSLPFLCAKGALFSNSRRSWTEEDVFKPSQNSSKRSLFSNFHKDKQNEPDFNLHKL